MTTTEELGTFPDDSDAWYSYADPGWCSNDPTACYDFYLFGVWIVDGKGYWTTDSGCSCPSPFEDVCSVDDLEEGDFAKIMAAYDDYIEGYGYGEGSPHPEHVADRVVLAKWLVDNL